MAEHTKKQKPMTIEISEAALQDEVEAFNAVNAQIQQTEGALVQMRAEREQRSGRLSILQEQLSKAMGNDPEEQEPVGIEAQNNGEGDPEDVPEPQEPPERPKGARAPGSLPPAAPDSPEAQAPKSKPKPRRKSTSRRKK